ncbi:MAG: alginate export family protein [Saprospiraceae bacterium]|jgi:hypothetical protein|nr:alginate export family protein [Saprospiraceae bacterium]
MRYLFICLLVALLHTVSWSQLTLTGEIRPRAEYRQGFKSLFPEDADPAFFVEQRSRLYMKYQASKLKLQINLQDVRIWGNASQIYKADPALTNVHEAWAELVIAGRWSAKFGRQEIDYDGARFLGDLSWAQQSRTHDALLVKYEHPDKGWKLHLAGAYNQNVPFEPTKLTGNFYEGVNNYKTMQYAWLNKQFPEGSLSVLLHNDGRQAADTTVAFRQTVGTRWVKKFGAFSLDGELYFQTGKDAAKKEVSTLLAAANLSAKLGKATLTLGTDYLSGTDVGETKNTAFDPLYGTNHKFYGYMDYFYVGNPHQQDGRTVGLVDIFLKSNFPLGKAGKLDLHLHGFVAPVDVLDGAGKELKPYLGTEFDAVFTRQFFDGMASLNLGYSQMFGTATLEAIKGGDRNSFNTWIWTMVTLKPVLFSSSKTKE